MLKKNVTQSFSLVLKKSSDISVSFSVKLNFINQDMWSEINKMENTFNVFEFILLYCSLRWEIEDCGGGERGYGKINFNLI